MRRICYLTIFVTLMGQHINATVWKHDEAIIVDYSDEPSTTEDTTAVPIPNRCVTSYGAVGSCIPAKQCYPNVFPNTEQGNFYGKSSNLQESISNFTEPCGTDEETTLSADGSGSRPFYPGDEKICCATIDRAIAENTPFPTFQEQATEELPTPDPSDPATTPTCNYTNYTLNPIVTEKLLIVGGQQVPITRYPFMVAVMLKGKPHCGGSLISPNLVLTAAHCVHMLTTPESLQLLKLYIGTGNIHTIEPGSLVRTVTNMAMHSRFNFDDFRDDIALLKLNAPVQYNDRVRAVCCTSCGETGNAEVAGWGKIVNNGPTSQLLRAVDIPLWDNSLCNRKYQQFPAPTPRVTPGMICAGSQDGRKDSCQGDSGGPLFKTGGCQVGIVSWGIKCGEFPGVYTRLSQYKKWLEKYQRILSAKTN